MTLLILIVAPTEGKRKQTKATLPGPADSKNIIIQKTHRPTMG